MLDDRCGTAILIQPLGGSFRADARYAGYVVGTVANQCQVIDDLFRKDIELFLDAIAVQYCAAHGVDQGDVVIDELRHVFVTGRYQDLHAVCRGLPAQGANDIVGLDAFDSQHRQTHGWHGFEQRIYLQAQVIGHWRPVRLVCIEYFVPKRFSGSVEYHHEVLGVLLLRELQ